jgi:ElaB/YqjD/DUF883 family membrane-anchored ribosome-binding protein
LPDFEGIRPRLEETMASSDTGSQSQETGGQQSSAVEQAKSEAGRLTQAARSRTMSYLEERKSSLADNVGGMASAVRGAAEQFDEHGNAAVADYIQRAADGLERLSDTLRNRDLSSLMGDAEEFARRQPAVFIGAGVAVGFVLARFLKSSSERREAERYGYRGGYDYARGSGAESSFGRHAYQEGMTGSPDTTWSQSGASEGPSRRRDESEGLARQEMREGFTGSSRPGGPVSGGAAGGSSTATSSSTGRSTSGTSTRKERRNASDT